MITFDSRIAFRCAVITALLAMAFTLAAMPAQARAMSLEQQTALRCSAAFALVSAAQAHGDGTAAAYPDLSERGREFFVQASARLMDETALSRQELGAKLRTEALALQDGDALAAIMPGCLLLLDASGL